MNQAAWFGVWLLVGASVVIVIELAFIAAWSVRLGRRARATALLIQSQQGMIQADVVRLRMAMLETTELWRPYARALRWLQHPLVAALIASYRRRWAAR